MAHSVIVGGSSGLGLAIAQRLASRGDEVVITGRQADKAEAVARELGSGTRGLAMDLARPETIEGALASISSVDNLVITAIEQAVNSLRDYDIAQAIRSVTVKLVGYTEVVRVLHPRFATEASVVLFGGLAKDRPYPGSTMVTTFNAGVSGLIRTLAVEIAPYRVNALHPGIVGDSPKWREVPNHPHLRRTPIGRLVTMAEIADATEFLLRNKAMNAHDLVVDGGLLVT
jgi:NAD(P)-dependent dehydrogenase (short-subunit alcohol dehydrogenase family)